MALTCLVTVQNLDAIASIARTAGIPLLGRCSTNCRQDRNAMQIRAPMFVACSAHKALLGLPGLGILTLPENTKLSPQCVKGELVLLPKVCSILNNFRNVSKQEHPMFQPSHHCVMVWILLKPKVSNAIHRKRNGD